MQESLVGRACAWQLQLGAPMGHLRDHPDDQLAPEDLLDVVPIVARMIEAGSLTIRVGNNVGYYGPYERTLRAARDRPEAIDHWMGCLAGCRNVGIESDGNVKGCLSLQATSVGEGNVNASSLVDIWHRPGGFAYNRHFRMEDLEGFCRTCEYASVCRGGCLSMRMCHGGRDNPFCYHRVATPDGSDASDAPDAS